MSGKPRTMAVALHGFFVVSDAGRQPGRDRSALDRWMQNGHIGVGFKIPSRLRLPSGTIEGRCHETFGSMTAIDRRQILSGVAGAALSVVLPAPLLAITTDHDRDDRFCGPQEVLADLERENLSASMYEAVAENCRWWNFLWQQSYIGVVGLADQLRQTITDDTPETRAILAKAAAILSPACERAHTYWQPIPGLSRTFRKASKRYYGLRAARIELRGDMNPAFFNAWTTIQGETLQLKPRTSGDREFQKRVLQALGNDDLLDLGYLRSRGGDWTSFIHDTFSTRCGALPCRRCAEWLA